jgi:uncharacterized protein YmfQ (DUF2313 family)
MLQSLLPKGRAWTRVTGSTLSQVLSAIADEFVRLEQAALSLLIERDTRFTSDLLTDHEYDLGLPDECSTAADSITERRNQAHAKLISLGGADKQYFIDMAAALGYNVTIQEYPDADLSSIFYWQVTALYDEDLYLRQFLCGGNVSGDPLSEIVGIDMLECFISRYKPAHTEVQFVLDGPEFSSAFSLAFKAMYPDDGNSGAFDRAFGIEFDVCYGGAFNFDEFDSSFSKPG